jgi:hypothetical protein
METFDRRVISEDAFAVSLNKKKKRRVEVREEKKACRKMRSRAGWSYQ